MFSLFSSKHPLHKEAEKVIKAVNDLEPEIQALSGDELKTASLALMTEIRALPESEREHALNRALPRAFAFVREAAKRTLGQRHYDVQLLAGYVLHNRAIAEMKTGEGKTLSSTLPIYLNALAGKGAHVITVNEYLAKRDMVWMGQVYNALGLSVACLIHNSAVLYDPGYTQASPVQSQSDHGASADKENPLAEGGLIDKERDTTGAFLVQEEFLRPTSRKEAYETDITYGTNHEFGFDYLRDNLQQNITNQVQREYPFAIIDEVDSILIDEARTPLIIAAPDEESSEYYKQFSRIVKSLEKDVDYVLDEKTKAADITEAGIDKVEKLANVPNIYAPEYIRLTHYLQESLRAHGVFQLDKDYVVKDGEVIIVDQFTGRLMHGRRYNGGLHQAIEAKEGVKVQQESRTYASISIQNYFRMYSKLAGMTGTALTSAEEFHKVYGLEVVSIPTNRPLVRKDESDLIYKNNEAKYNAIIEDIRARHEHGQPILIGTVSIEKNEELGAQLKAAGLPHEMLNAKNNEREGAIIAQAGRPGAITVATNMAGRGVDIILGGNPTTAEAAMKVREAGGLHVIGTERHESRRIDDQLRGRSGRQGDPGSTQFFLSLEDDLVRVFGGERISSMMGKLNLPDDMPIQAGMLTKAIENAQKRVEGRNFDSRKHMLEYDDVLNKQRQAIYRRRQRMLEAASPGQIIAGLDMLWMTHLEDMSALQDSVRLRAVGQKDPLVEYRREGHLIFKQMEVSFEEMKTRYEEQLAKHNAAHATQSDSPFSKGGAPQGRGISTTSPIKQHPEILETPLAQGDAPAAPKKEPGRNEPCPCGSGKKYKKCHGANT
ncbi:MAG: preprotein translocase subunit SecA [Candidatus Harrisonbacteria bacterium CG10_big_fil_rev_8_21_14_0_10_49_15]|uniref:Protein translocase subunit SecA n=1 Tax=Candidatus Harrisonbacteria bacterium CG10_big_fil_rev_8_21_14_0_10_49_15 TaxID=1974587 RepID=A0A2H0UKM1_9BACT|nr:MAG: preprotein translocase subunit SecA [Candidatus Harrisonbacteria bacterium CG10_big_fil_rev_8_21_14_0_10_49_15]